MEWHHALTCTSTRRSRNGVMHCAAEEAARLSRAVHWAAEGRATHSVMVCAATEKTTVDRGQALGCTGRSQTETCRALGCGGRSPKGDKRRHPLIRPLQPSGAAESNGVMRCAAAEGALSCRGRTHTWLRKGQLIPAVLPTCAVHSCNWVAWRHALGQGSGCGKWQPQAR